MARKERATFLPFDLDADPKHSTLAFRKHEADFQVEEVLAFEPSGEGHHLFLRIEKKGLSTAHLIQRLSERWGIPRKAIGFAGRKDQRGLTRQWLSVPDTYFEGKTPDDLEIDGVRTLEVRRNNKIKTGPVAKQSI